MRLCREKSYSHPATKQDDWVYEKLGHTGTFCEVGAYDGVTHSNTLMLEKVGWRGILIEAWETFYLSCKQNRPGSTCYHAVIGDNLPKNLIVGGQYTGLAETMPPAWLEEHHCRCNPLYTVDTCSLYKFVQAVDYLSIDTEGGEYEILRDWLEDGGLARAITVEFRYDTSLLHKFERLCGDWGYVLDEVRGFDLCFLMNK